MLNAIFWDEETNKPMICVYCGYCAKYCLNGVIKFDKETTNTAEETSLQSSPDSGESKPGGLNNTLPPNHVPIRKLFDAATLINPVILPELEKQQKIMSQFPQGNAIIYCEGAFGTPNGKTAHGLIRRTSRYKVLSVIDSKYAGRDAGEVLDGKSNGIPVLANLKIAYECAQKRGDPASYLVIGLAPDGGRLSPDAREAVKQAIKLGLNVDSGLHDFLSDDPAIAALARQHHVKIRDVRKTPPRNELHFFSGKIEQVDSLKIAVLGTDSAVGKRTTAWLLVDAFQKAGYSAEMIGTGQTAWLQGARYSIMLDSIINDFVSGEIEHAVWSAWNDHHPDVIVIEGQGSLMNPAFPGGFEILAAGRPDVVIVQHAPARTEYDGFPGYPIHPLDQQIQAIELVAGKPVVVITINHEKLSLKEIPPICNQIQKTTGLPAIDVLLSGADEIVSILKPYFKI